MRDDLVDVYDAMNLVEAQLLKARLDAAGIKTFLDNDDSPLDGLNAADQYVTVRVAPADAEKAKEVVAEFEQENAAEFEAELGEEEDEEEK